MEWIRQSHYPVMDKKIIFASGDRQREADIMTIDGSVKENNAERKHISQSNLSDMEFQELITKRQSTRKYLKTPVDRKLVEKCLEAARLAPSACNSQPWHFVVLDDPVRIREIGEAAASLGMNSFAADVPVVVAAVLEKMNFTAKVGSMLKNKDYCMLDLGIAVEHFCLQAAEDGLGTCILGWFDEKKVARLAGVPKGKRIPLLITLGYPDCEIRKKIRKPLEDIVSWNNY